MPQPDFSNSDSELDRVLAAKQAASQIVEVDAPLIQLVIFQLGEGYFAFHGHTVKEVLGTDVPVNFVPGMPDSVEGIINLRGDVESVIRLHPLLQIPPLAIEQQTGSRILMCQAADISTGIRIDALHDVTDISETELKPPPDSLPDALKPYVTALLSYKQWTVAVLDLDMLLQHWRQQNR